MTYFIDHATGCAYWLENDPIEGALVLFAPLLANGTFNTEDGGYVEEWASDDVQERVVQALQSTK